MLEPRLRPSPDLPPIKLSYIYSFSYAFVLINLSAKINIRFQFANFSHEKNPQNRPFSRIYGQKKKLYGQNNVSFAGIGTPETRAFSGMNARTVRQRTGALPPKPAGGFRCKTRPLTADRTCPSSLSGISSTPAARPPRRREDTSRSGCPAPSPGSSC